MRKPFICMLLMSMVISAVAISQRKFGYAVLYLRCGDKDPHRNRVYFSPVIELDRLNIHRYTNGVDTSVAPYSVRYYNYCISKWFEIYLKERYKVAVNDKEKYERDASATVLNIQPVTTCNPEKTLPGCFYTNKEALLSVREAAIIESKLTADKNGFCEIIDLR